MWNCLLTQAGSLLGAATAIALSLTSPMAAEAQSAATPRPGLAQLPTQTQTTLKAGQVVVSGENGQYTGHVLVTAPVDVAWKVLTDYEHFKDFLPGVVASRILSTAGNETVFEQVNSVRLLLFTQTSRLVIAATQQYPQQIKFHMQQGQIKSLNGIWQLEPVNTKQVLITQKVQFDPGNAAPRGIAFNIYKNTLVDSLKAIKKETEKRADNPTQPL